MDKIICNKLLVFINVINHKFYGLFITYLQFLKILLDD